MKKIRFLPETLLVRFGFCIYLFCIGFLIGGGMSKTIKALMLS